MDRRMLAIGNVTEKSISIGLDCPIPIIMEQWLFFLITILLSMEYWENYKNP